MAKRSLSQHFLTSPTVAQHIARAAEMTADDTVIEVGPGKGMLTRALLREAGTVIAIEKDAALADALCETFSDAIANNVLHIQTNDVLETEPQELISSNETYYVVSNIPYAITGAFLRHFLSAKKQPETMVLLVQKEVADQIARKEHESILSISVKAYGTPEYLSTVRAECFRPKPKVDSAILRVSNITRSRFSDLDESWFFTVLRAGFAHKRKRVLRNLETLAPRENIERAFEAADINGSARAETLSVEQWKVLAEKLHKAV